MSLKSKLKQNLDDTGVSPVVGVILMVAITVILAAVIGTFVLGLGDQVQSSATAGVDFNENTGTDMTVTLNTVQNADSIYVESTSGGAVYNVSNSSINVVGGVGSGDADYNGGGEVENFLLNSNGEGGAGTTVTVKGDAYNTSETVQVIGVLSGNENVIQDQQMG